MQKHVMGPIRLRGFRNAARDDVENPTGCVWALNLKPP